MEPRAKSKSPTKLKQALFKTTSVRDSQLLALTLRSMLTSEVLSKKYGQLFSTNPITMDKNGLPKSARLKNKHILDGEWSGADTGAP